MAKIVVQKFSISFWESLGLGSSWGLIYRTMKILFSQFVEVCIIMGFSKMINCEPLKDFMK